MARLLAIDYGTKRTGIAVTDELQVLGITINLTSENEHVPRIERQIRVTKERARAIQHTLPFTVIPKTMVLGMISQATMWLNAFPPKGGVSEILSPCTLITGVQMD